MSRDFFKQFTPQIRPQYYLLTFLFGALQFFASDGFAQAVVADGGTATTVLAPAASGQITIEIAPAAGASISHNTYSAFSVPSPGVNLNNNAVNAGTIINEVTSTNVTTIEGPLTVLGPQADVIVANPNGISVNGGRFVNTGNVALTTGRIGNLAGPDPVASTVTGGAITIGPGGLSGTMEELALISKTLRLDGPLQFDTISNRAHLNIITGSSTVSFDRVRGGAGVDGLGLLPWAFASNQGADSADAIVVDITRNGRVNSGRISVTVTDQGAGVRIAGDQMAAAGDFRLTGSGQLEVVGSKIETQGSVNVNAGSVTLTSNDTDRVELTSTESGVVLNAQNGDINLGSAKLSGRTIASDTLASSGGVTLISKGQITSTKTGTQGAELISDIGSLAVPIETSVISVAADQGLRFDGLQATASGDIRLGTDGTISLTDITATAGLNFNALALQNIALENVNISTTADLRFDAVDLEVSNSQLTSAVDFGVQASGGLRLASTTVEIGNDLVAQVDGALEFTSSEVSVQNTAQITTGDLTFNGTQFSSQIDAEITASGFASFVDSTIETAGQFTATASNLMSFDAASLTAETNIRLQGSALRFGQDVVDQDRTSLRAASGSLVARATDGDILNFGSLIQGNSRSSQADAVGGVSLYATGRLLNKSLSQTRLAVAFGEADDFFVEVDGNVENITGRLFANTDIIINSGGDVQNNTEITGSLSPIEVSRLKGGRFASSLFLKRSKTTSISANFGTQAIDGEISRIFAIGDVSINAMNISSIGSEVSGRDVTLQADEVFDLRAAQTGALSFTRKCKFFCRTSGTSTLGFVGGAINASEELNITAGTRVRNFAGLFNGFEGVTITAPVTEFTPVFNTELIERPAGLFGLFRGRRGYLATEFLFGTVEASGGDITINGDANLGEATLTASGDVTISGTRIQSSEPTAPPGFEKRALGFVGNAF